MKKNIKSLEVEDPHILCNIVLDARDIRIRELENIIGLYSVRLRAYAARLDRASGLGRGLTD